VVERKEKGSRDREIEGASGGRGMPRGKWKGEMAK
jgi:hypothetical protein